jgi:hypothetical protein
MKNLLGIGKINRIKIIIRKEKYLQTKYIFNILKN